MFSYQVKTPLWLKLLFPGGLIWDISTDDKPTVYLPFDDGPHPTITPFVMEQLEQYGAKGTFFCVGDNVRKHPETYKCLLENGHAVANHTFNHLNGWKTDNAVYGQNISLATDCIHSHLFRPPYGKIKRSQVRDLIHADDKWKIIMWSVLSADFDKNITPVQCRDNVMKHIRPGSIVLFHDSEKAWERMSYALPEVLKFCSGQGWAMKAIPAN